MALVLGFTVFWAGLGLVNLDYCYLLHAVGAVLISAVSLLEDNGTTVEEMLVEYSFGYFVGHGFDLVFRNTASKVMLVHHVLALSLLVGVMLHPEFVEVKACSHVLLTEFSTLFLYMWEKHPSESSLGAFVVTYFCSRGIYLGYFIMRIFLSKDPNDIASHLQVGPFHYLTLLLFILNMVYFSKILVPSIPRHLKKLRKIDD